MKRISFIVLFALIASLFIVGQTPAPAYAAGEYSIMSILRYNPHAVTAAQMDNWIASVRPDSRLIGHTQMFIDAGNKYNLDPVYAMAHAILESGWGNSDIARDKNNLYGWMAYDSDPDNAKSFSSMEACTDYVMGKIIETYLTPGAEYYTSYGPTLAGMNVNYATSQTWRFSICSLMNEFAATIPGYPYAPIYGDYDASYVLLDGRTFGSDSPMPVHAGATYSFAVKLTNYSKYTWSAGGANPTYIGYHWNQNGVTGQGWISSAMPYDVAPGQTVTMFMEVKAPDAGGRYTLAIDMVHYGVTWFADRWVPTLDIPVDVYQTVYRGDRAASITSSELSAYPPGGALLALPGTLLQGSSSGIFVTDLSGGTYTKRGFNAWSDFIGLGFHPEDIVRVTDSELGQYAAGPDVAGPTPHPNGMLVKGSGAAVYLLEDSRKRPIASATAFASLGYRWDRIVTVSASELSTYPEGQPVQARSGSILKGSGSTVYVTDYTEGTYKKRPISTAEVFDGLGLQWSDLATVTDAELATYVTGPAVSSVTPRPNGLLIKSGAACYVLVDGQRRQLPGYLYQPDEGAAFPAIGVSLGTIAKGSTVTLHVLVQNTGSTAWQGGAVSVSYRWVNADNGKLVAEGLKTVIGSGTAPGESATVNAQVQAPSSTGSYILQWDLYQAPGWLSAYGSQTYQMAVNVHSAFPGGLLIKGAGAPDVYLTTNGQKQPLSLSAFLSNGFAWDHIQIVSDNEAAAMTTGQPVSIRTGTLVKGSTAPVYVVEGAKKRFITSADIFNGLGLRWDRILTIPDAELAALSDGSPVDGTGGHTSGMLIKGPASPTVYYLDNGTKRSVSYASFVGNAFRWEDVMTVSDAELASFAPGVVFQARPGTLIKGSSASVYCVDNNGLTTVKRPIASADVFTSLGFRWEEILTIGDDELSQYMNGTPVN